MHPEIVLFNAGFRNHERGRRLFVKYYLSEGSSINSNQTEDRVGDIHATRKLSTLNRNTLCITVG